MEPIKEIIDTEGRISIKKIMQGTNIRPGDLVEVIPGESKIIVKIIKQDKPKGIIEKIAGKWKDRPDISADILSARKESEREVPEIE